MDADIERRCSATREQHPFWPCAEGCAQCCRSLARLPEITAPEWERLRARLEAMPDELRAAVGARLDAESGEPGPGRGRVTCPMLDVERDACLVYDERPIACRTYGFYTERDAGLHCDRVTAAIERSGATDAVVWGNGEAIADDLRALGESRSLRAWWDEWRAALS